MLWLANYILFQYKKKEKKRKILVVYESAKSNVNQLLYEMYLTSDVTEISSNYRLIGKML